MTKIWDCNVADQGMLWETRRMMCRGLLINILIEIHQQEIRPIASLTFLNAHEVCEIIFNLDLAIANAFSKAF